MNSSNGLGHNFGVGSKIPAMMTESVLAGPNFRVISCLCLCTAKWSSLVNLWKEGMQRRM